MQFFITNRPLALIGYARAAIYSIASLACVACNSLPQTVSVDFPEPPEARPIATVPKASGPTSGSLFQKASYRPAFEDPRARTVGDHITIQIIEKVTASQVSKSTANRSSTGSTSVSAFPLIAPQDLINLKAGVGTSSAQDFAGKRPAESHHQYCIGPKSYILAP